MHLKWLQLHITFIMVSLALSGCIKNNLAKFNTREPSSFEISKRIKQGKLPNGLTYFFMKNQEPQGRCFLRFNVNIGSFSEKDDESGMAHFIKHLAFDNRAVSAEIRLAEWFLEHGMSIGADANAYTSADTTTYQIDLPRCDEKDLKEALAIFRSFADGLNFSKESIDKEMKIIESEERSRTSADLTTLDVVAHLYSGTLFSSRPVLGKANIRKNFSPAALTEFYRRWYQPKNMAIVIVGDYKDIDLTKLISDNFISLKENPSYIIPPQAGTPDYKYPVFIVHQTDMAYIETIYSIQAKKIVKPHYTKKLLKERLIFDLALNIISERYNKFTGSDILKKPEIYGFLYDEKTYDLSLSSTGRVDNYQASFIEAFKVLKNTAEVGPTDAELDDAKNILLDKFEQLAITDRTTSSSVWAEKLTALAAQKEFPMDANNYLNFAREIIPSIKKHEVKAILKKAIKSGNEYIFAIGALENTSSNLNNLKNLLNQTKSMSINSTAKTNKVVFKYHQNRCNNVKTPRSSFIDSIGTYQVNINNDVHALLKPTSFKKDEISLQIIIEKGYGPMNQAELTTAAMAQALFSTSGLNKHTPEEVSEIFKDKLLFISISIFEDRTIISAVTRNKDINFALEYIKAYLTDAAYDEASLKRIKAQLAVGYAQFDKDINAPLQHEFIKDLSNNDFRVGRIPLELLNSVTREQLRSWHNTFFSAPLKIVMVGDFVTKIAAEELYCLFSTLGSKEQISNKKIENIKFKPGINKIYKINSQELSSKIFFRYPLDFSTTFMPDYRYDLMRDIVAEIIRLKLKEKKQAIYTPSVTITRNFSGMIQNTLDITLTVEKKQAEELRKYVVNTLEKLALHGVTKPLFRKAKAPLLSRAAQIITENEFWVNALSYNFNNPSALRWVDNLSQDINAITNTEINMFLKKYLRSSNVATAIVHSTNGLTK